MSRPVGGTRAGHRLPVGLFRCRAGASSCVASVGRALARPPLPSRASVSPSPLERCGSSVSGVYDGLRTLDQRRGWRSRPQLDPCLPLAARGSPGDWAPTFHSVANLGDRLLSFFSQQGCGKITRAFRVLLPPDKLAFQCQPGMKKAALCTFAKMHCSEPPCCLGNTPLGAAGSEGRGIRDGRERSAQPSR